MTRGPARPPEEGSTRPAAAQEQVDRAVADFKAGRRREESFRFLHDTFYPAVRSHFKRRGSSGQECFDLTQETFLRVFKGLNGYRGDAPFGAWVWRIARNVHEQLVVRRTAGRTEDLDSEEVALSRLASEPEGPARVLDQEQRRRLREAVRLLPGQRRKCIVLWAYHGLAYEEVAVVMRLSIGTVKAHLAQAREQLRELLGEGR